jgi:tRNA-guanine family transglycosylase
LEFQEKHADIGATLDFIIPPGIEPKEGAYRQELSFKNAIWAMKNRKRKDLRLFASIQAWDPDSAKRIMERLAALPFDGFALGGMVPRAHNPEIIIDIVRAIREVETHAPLHVFGVGHPGTMKRLHAAGADSTDSSSVFRLTVSKKYLDPEKADWITIDSRTKIHSMCSCPICRSSTSDFLIQSGEANNLALALHNLYALRTCG